MLVGIIASIIATVIVAFFVSLHEKVNSRIQSQLKKYIFNLIHQIENYQQFVQEKKYEYNSIISEFDLANHFIPLTAVEYYYKNESHPHSFKVHNDVEAFILDQIDLNTKSFLFILGEFGTGKTALSTHISYIVGKKYLSRQSKTIPILFTMSDIQTSDIFSELCRLMKERYNVTNITQEYLIAEVRSGKILLIFDGLDEYMQLQSKKTPYLVLKKLQEITTQYSKIILTSRPSAFRTPEELVGYFKQGKEDLLLISKRLAQMRSATILEIRNYSDEQIIDVVSKRKGFDSNFKDVIFKNKNIHQLARQPILLDMILRVLPNIIEKNDTSSLIKIDISGLYKIFISYSIKRDLWKLEVPSLNEEKAITICEKIALEMFNTQKDEINDTTILSIINQIINLNNVQSLEINSIVNHIHSSLFLTVMPQKKYRFMHRSVLEYFVAQGLVRAIRNRKFLNLNLKKIVYHEAVSHFARSIFREEDINILIELLRHKEPWVRFISAHYLSRVNANRAIKNIYDNLEFEEKFIVRREFYIALAFLGKVNFFHNFINEIALDKSMNSKNNQLIIEYFGSLASALDGCTQRLKEGGNYPTREMIIKFLGLNGQREHIPIIRKYLNDKIEFIGIESRKAITNIKKRLGQPCLIKALLCDVDGVIVNSIDQHIEAWQKAFQVVVNTEFDSNLIRITEGLRSYEVAEYLLNNQNKSIPNQKIQEIVDKKQEYMKEIEPISSFFPNTLEMIREAKNKGLKIVLITASNKERAESIRKALGDDLIDSLVSGSDTKEGKPSPDPYILGLKKIKCSHNQAIVIENAPLGIDSAQSANIFCAGLTSTLKPEQLFCADMIISSALDVLPLVK